MGEEEQVEEGVEKTATPRAGVDSSVIMVSQRKHKRHRWSGGVQVAWLDLDEATEPVVMQGYDLSAGGIAIISQRHIAPGSIGVILLDKGGGEALIRGIQVRHCRPLGQTYHLFGSRWTPIPDNVRITTRRTDQGLTLNRPVYEEPT